MTQSPEFRKGYDKALRFEIRIQQDIIRARNRWNVGDEDRGVTAVCVDLIKVMRKMLVAGKKD